MKMPEIDHRKFILKEAYFDHPGLLHGINHTYRVMYHVVNIGRKAGLTGEILPAWCAAFIHDMARQHDGYCTEHGQWSAERKLLRFEQLFRDSGVDDNDIQAIRLAVINHSQRSEIDAGHPHYKTVALLKDADALDRIRIGEGNLRVKYLRYPETIGLIDFAKELYYKSDGRLIRDFQEMYKIAEQI